MIQPNELRIGNLVNDPSLENGRVAVSQIVWDVDHYVVAFFNDNMTIGTQLEDIEPIPLSPEILEKCGFEPIKHSATSYRYVNKGLDFGVNIHFTGRGYLSPEYIVRAPIQYLHQLQNFVFVITGEELKFQE